MKPLLYCLLPKIQVFTFTIAKFHIYLQDPLLIHPNLGTCHSSYQGISKIQFFLHKFPMEKTTGRGSKRLILMGEGDEENGDK